MLEIRELPSVIVVLSLQTTVKHIKNYKNVKLTFKNYHMYTIILFSSSIEEAQICNPPHPFLMDSFANGVRFLFITIFMK